MKSGMDFAAFGFFLDCSGGKQTEATLLGTAHVKVYSRLLLNYLTFEIIKECLSMS